MLQHCRRLVCLRSLLHDMTSRGPSHPSVTLSRGLSQTVSHPTVTVLQEDTPGRSPVHVTLADNPGIIVCHHPPNKINYSLTKPVVKEPEAQQPITGDQIKIAMKLIEEQPLVWNVTDIAKLFNVTEDSVNSLQIPSHILDKQATSQEILSTWSLEDQTAFSSYRSNAHIDKRNQLLVESSELFKFCKFDRDEELAKIKLYALNSEFPDDFEQISDS